ncbi:hypothetical protein SMKI_05G0870 [Saccharomyces mikatae IFO 1815]|uniref:Uncharacterized protein n=1 Tax=Saccharomyces mikatae IFO 1815 TaxID=226126 RepID=A0AA35NF72_SACMI|nr:uncharacterized protein SMKI_05G0870 [Saccharomyces mikatae IFO 1815]CAI4038477.1 hypothetical protein SMKI_05G0870 [Saccharomyces mikatae IFO 1815]
MAYTKIALFAAIAAFASAQTQDQINELNVILNDVKSNIQEYISLASDPNSGFSLASMPAGILDLGMALASATDDSYTTFYSEVDFAGVSKMLTQVPWYSSRLAPALKSLEGDASSSAAPSSTEAKTSSSAAPSSTEAKTSSSAAPSSTEAKTSSSAAPSSTEAKTSSSAAPSSSEAKTSSSAAPSSSEAKTSSAATSSAKVSSSAVASSAKVSSSAVASSAKASAISQITDGQIQATKTVAQQTENGAAKAFVGMGAGVVAAAAMLL